MVFLYGEATHRNIQRLETLRIKTALTRATRRNIPEDTILLMKSLLNLNLKAQNYTSTANCTPQGTVIHYNSNIFALES
jgi:hypothetical protein